MENINTIDYWNNRFTSIRGFTDWELCNGVNQSVAFMEAILKGLPKKTKEDMEESSILDFGCALGDGTKFLSMFLENNKVTGYDFSNNAVDIAKRKYTDLEFINVTKVKKYDYIICSNVLQCVDDYIGMMKEMMKLCNKAIVILVPFGDYGTTVEHFNKFQFADFPRDIEGFYRRAMKAVSTKCWAYKQIIIRYERLDYESD